MYMLLNVSSCFTRQLHPLYALVCVQECGVGGADVVGSCVEGPVLLHGRTQHAVPHHLGHQLVH